MDREPTGPTAPSVMPAPPADTDPLIALAADGFALSRMALGTAALLAPGLVGRAFGIGDAPGTRLAARYLGGRDLVLGLGMYLGRRHGRARGWFEGAALVDTIDTVATLGAMRRGAIGRRHGLAVLLLTSSSAATAALLGRLVDDSPPTLP